MLTNFTKVRMLSLFLPLFVFKKQDNREINNVSTSALCIIWKYNQPYI